MTAGPKGYTSAGDITWPGRRGRYSRSALQLSPGKYGKLEGASRGVGVSCVMHLNTLLFIHPTAR
jgi:hypothetical protein